MAATSLVGQDVSPTATTALAAPNASGTVASGTSSASNGTLAGSLGSLLTTALTAGSGVYGAQNAAEDQQQADVAAMGTQNTAMTNIGAYWQPQQTAGVNAVNALSAAQGLNGQAPDYSGFENMPGYQFAVTQGTLAAERAASAQGAAYTPNTAIAVGNQITGTAMQDYNTYISQLLSTAGLGSTANQNLQGAQLQTSANVSQLQQNTGQAAASGVTSGSNAVAGQVGNVVSALLGNGGNSSGILGSLFGSGSGSSSGSGSGSASSGGLLGSISSLLSGSSSLSQSNINAGLDSTLNSMNDPNSDFQTQLQNQLNTDYYGITSGNDATIAAQNDYNDITSGNDATIAAQNASYTDPTTSTDYSTGDDSGP